MRGRPRKAPGDKFVPVQIYLPPAAALLLRRLGPLPHVARDIVLRALADFEPDELLPRLTSRQRTAKAAKQWGWE